MKFLHPDTNWRWLWLVLLTIMTCCVPGTFLFAQTDSGMALSFDGVDDHVSVTPSPALELTNGTIEFWMNPGAQVGDACLLAHRGHPSTQTRYSLHLSHNTLGLWNGATYQTVPFSGTTGRWYHVAAVLSSTNAQFFLNGVPLGVTTNGINTAVAGVPFTLGAAYTDAGNPGDHFAGVLDEVRVWNVARTEAEIQATMAQPLTNTPASLVACYRFDEAAGIAAYDASPHHLHGTLVNRPTRVPSF